MKMKGSSFEGLPASSMRIARNVLRRMLVDAVSSEDTVKWITTCTGAVQLPNGKVQVQLSNGQANECDLLVAKDGAHSRIRSILRPNDKLLFAGAVCIAGNSRFPSGVPEPVNRDWGCVLSGNGTRVFVSPVDQHSAVWSFRYLDEPRKRLKPPLSKEEIDCLIRE
ncbi:hypothetical protein V1522DRAFT_446216 [Lipomyces starkeyi]